MSVPPLGTSPDTDGARVLSSWVDLDDAVDADHADRGQVAFAAAAAGLDSLAVVMDPVGELAAAGVGWLIEHVWFLREPLDALAGDPDQIRAQARRWYEASDALHAVARDHRRATAVVTGWDGAAAHRYRGTVGEHAHRLHLAADAAETVSDEVLTSGAAVGTVRALIRDVIADFVGGLTKKALLALATTPASAGGSLLAFCAAAAAEAVQLADDITRRLDDLLRLLGISAARLETALKRMQLVREGTVEAGKQFGQARQEHRSWTDAPVGGF